MRVLVAFLISCSVAYAGINDNLQNRWTFNGDSVDVITNATSIDHTKIPAEPIIYSVHEVGGTPLNPEFLRVVFDPDISRQKYIETQETTGFGANWSVSFWHLGSPLEDKVFLAHWNGGAAADEGVLISTGTGVASGKLKVLLSSDGTTRTKEVTFPTVVQDAANWVHVVVTFDASLAAANELKVYVNSVLESAPSGTNNETPTINAPAVPYTIGAKLENGIAVKHLNGSMDDLRVYDATLTQTDVNALYAFTAHPKTLMFAEEDLGCVPRDPTFNNAGIIQQYLNGWGNSTTQGSNTGTLLFSGKEYYFARTIRTNTVSGGRIQGTATWIRPHDATLFNGPHTQLVWNGPTFLNGRDGVITGSTFDAAGYTNWVDSGATDDHKLRILQGDNRGLYTITAVDEMSLTISPTPTGDDLGTTGGLAWTLELSGLNNGTIIVGDAALGVRDTFQVTGIDFAAAGVGKEHKLVLMDGSLTGGGDGNQSIYDIENVSGGIITLKQNIPDEDPTETANQDWEIRCPMVILQGYGVYWDGVGLRGRENRATTGNGLADIGILVRGQHGGIGTGKHYFSALGISHCNEALVFGQSDEVNNADSTTFGTYQANWCNVGLHLRTNQTVENNIAYYRPYNTRIGVKVSGGGKFSCHKAEITTTNNTFLQLNGYLQANDVRTFSGDTGYYRFGDIVFDNVSSGSGFNVGFKVVEGLPGFNNQCMINFGCFYGPNNLNADNRPWFELHGLVQLNIDHAYYWRADSVLCKTVAGVFSPMVSISNARMKGADHIRDTIDTNSDLGYRFYSRDCVKNNGGFFPDFTSDTRGSSP